MQNCFTVDHLLQFIVIISYSFPQEDTGLILCEKHSKIVIVYLWSRLGDYFSLTQII